MKGINFLEDKNGINFNEFSYLKDMFKLLKCGVEFEFEFNSTPYYRDIEDKLGSMKRDYEVFGVNTCGVASVKGDGSLVSGCEIVTNGRLFHTPYLHYCQYKNIFNAIEWKNNMSPRTGMHMHFLLSTGNDGDSNLERNLNILFIKNFLTLCKKYLPAMTYLTSTNYKEVSGRLPSITRYSGFSKYNTLYDVNINEIETPSDLKEKYILRDGRYQSINLCCLPIRRSNGDLVIENYHVEFRLADGALCPSHATLVQFMYKGLIELALETSLVGEIKDEYTDTLIKMFKNNVSGRDYPNTDDRYSVNVMNEENYIALKSHCKDFLEAIECYVSKEVIEGLERIIECPVGQKAHELNDMRVLDEYYNTFKPTSGIVKHEVIKSLLNIDHTSLNDILLTSKENSLDLEDVNRTLDLLKSIGEFGGKKWN